MPMGTIQKMGVKHEAILDWTLEFPFATHAECAAHFGVTRVWITCIRNSDAFRAALKERQANIQGMLDVTLADQIRGTASYALESLGNAMESMQNTMTVNPTAEFYLDAADRLLHRAGYAPSKGPTTAIQVNNNVQNNIIPVQRDVLAECRQEMLSNATAQSQQLPAPKDEDVINAVFTKLEVQTAGEAE